MPVKNVQRSQTLYIYITQNKFHCKGSKYSRMLYCFIYNSSQAAKFLLCAKKFKNQLYQF